MSDPDPTADPSRPPAGGVPATAWRPGTQHSDTEAVLGRGRVRVRSTDPWPDADGPAGDSPSGGSRAHPEEGDDDVAHYTRGLVRAQLRLGLACVVSFLAVVTLLTVTMSAVPALDAVVVLGVPLPWLVHAYGFYPVIVAFAVVFAVAAARNERRYRALAEGSTGSSEPGPDEAGAP